MKSFSSVLAIALSLSATNVLAQDEGSAHDGLLPLTTLPLTDQAGSTTGSETLYATAISTATISGTPTTIYSDISGIVTPTSVAETSTTSSASAATTSLPAISTEVTSSGSSTISVIVLSKTSSSGASAESTSLSTITGSGSGASTSSKASSTNKSSSTSSSTSSSSTANASGSSDSSAADRVVVGGLGVVGAVVAGLMVL